VVPLNIFMLYLRKVNKRTREERVKTTIWVVKLISASQTVTQAIQHPAVKKIRMNPGISNSAIKKTTPIRNHISEGERVIIFSIFIIQIDDGGAAQRPQSNDSGSLKL
jgi:hypothetical protein